MYTSRGCTCTGRSSGACGCLCMQSTFPFGCLRLQCSEFTSGGDCLHREEERRWRAEDLEQRALDNARALWARFVEKNRCSLAPATCVMLAPQRPTVIGARPRLCGCASTGGAQRTCRRALPDHAVLLHIAPCFDASTPVGGQCMQQDRDRQWHAQRVNDTWDIARRGIILWNRAL